MSGLQDDFEKFAKKRFGKTLNFKRCKNGDEQYLAWDTQVAYIAFCEGYHQGWQGHMDAAK